MPLAGALRHIVVEGALEVAAVRVLPSALDQLALLVATHKLLARLVENVSALAFLLTVGPLARVNVLVRVVHHALAVTLSILPVAIISAHSAISLFADAALQIVFPATVIGVCDWILDAGRNSVSVNAFTVTYLETKNEISFTILQFNVLRS